MEARRHRSALQRLLKSLSEPTSEQRLSELRRALEETQAHNEARRKLRVGDKREHMQVHMHIYN